MKKEMTQEEKEIIIYEICRSLAFLAGRDREKAIDCTDFLYERHPDVFESKEKLHKLVDKAISELEAQDTQGLKAKPRKRKQ